MTSPLASWKKAPRPWRRPRTGDGGRLAGGRGASFRTASERAGSAEGSFRPADDNFGVAEDDFGGSGGLFGGAEGLDGGAEVDFRGSEVAFADAEGSAFTEEWRFLARGAPRFRPSPPPFRD